MLPGIPNFAVVGLPDKVVGESRERVKSAIRSIGLSFPLKRVVVNLSPADLAKEGSHYDLPIAIALLAEMNIIKPVTDAVIMGELTLNGDIIRVNGILPAAALARSIGHRLICAADNGGEAALIDDVTVIA